MSTSADVDTAPCTGRLFFGSHDDRCVGCTSSVDFGSLLDEDVVHVVIVLGDDLHTCLNVQCCSGFYCIGTAQVVSVAGSQRDVVGDAALQGAFVGQYVVAFAPVLGPSGSPGTCGNDVFVRGVGVGLIGFVAVGLEFGIGIDALFAGQDAADAYVAHARCSVGQSVLGLSTFYINGVLFAIDFGILDGHLSTAAQVYTFTGCTVTYKDEVLQRRMSYGSGAVVVFVVVGFDQTVAGIAQCFFGFLNGDEVGSRTVPAFGPVERVVATAGDNHVADVDRSAEELETVVRSLVSLAVVNRCSATHAVEADTVGFVLLVESIAGVFQTYVLQNTRVVFVVVATVFGTADFRASLAAFGIGVGASADVDTAPGTRFFFFGSHDDGSRCRTFGVDFGSLLYQDVVYIVIVNGYNLYTRFDVQGSAFFYGVGTAQLVGVARFQGYVFGDCTAQRSAVGYSAVVVCCFVIAA